MAHWINVEECWWPNGTMPYSISDDFPPPNENPDSRREWVVYAIREMNKLRERTGLTLTEKTQEDPHSVVFVRSEGSCSSMVGMQGGVQQIRCDVGDGFGVDSVMHEIMHAAGIYHEHTRPDRKAYVRIMKDVIDPDKLHNFEKPSMPVGHTDDYDYKSLMHYHQYACLDDGYSGPSIICWNDEHGRQDYCPTTMGKVTRPSDLDIQGLAQIYKRGK